MSVFSGYADLMNAAVLGLCSDSMTWTPAVGSPVAFIGILDTSEIAKAGEDGSYGNIFVQQSDFTTFPQKGDHVAIGSTSYVVISDPNRHKDRAGGLYIYIRKT